MLNRKKAFASYTTNLVAIIAVYAVFMLLMGTGIIDRYYQGIIVIMGINIIMASSLNLATGFLGQLALGHAGFMSLGAYTSSLFVRYATFIPEQLSLIVSLLFGALVAGVISLIVGIPALRLKGDYLAIITLGFGEIIRVLIENLDFTGGAQGLTRIPRITSFTLVYVVMILTLVCLYCFVRSRHGRAVMAIREDSIAAEASGINVTFYRTLAFTLSASLAGVAGGLYAHQIGTLKASDFGFNRSIDFVVMVVFGGMGSLTGSIISAVALTLLPELLRTFADYRMLIYSLALVLLMIFKPTGLLGTYEFSLTRAYKNAPQNLKNLINWFKNLPKKLKSMVTPKSKKQNKEDTK